VAAGLEVYADREHADKGKDDLYAMAIMRAKTLTWKTAGRDSLLFSNY